MARRQRGTGSDDEDSHTYYLMKENGMASHHSYRPRGPLSLIPDPSRSSFYIHRHHSICPPHFHRSIINGY